MQMSELLMRLGVLFAGFPNAKPMDPALAREAYGRPLATIEDWAVINTLERFQRGEVEGQSLDFPPSISALVAEARRLVAEKARRDNLSAPRLPWRDPISPEERDRVGQKMAQLAADLATKLRTEQAADEALRRKRSRPVDADSLGDPRSLKERILSSRIGKGLVDEMEAGA